MALERFRRPDASVANDLKAAIRALNVLLTEANEVGLVVNVVSRETLTLNDIDRIEVEIYIARPI